MGFINMEKSQNLFFNDFYYIFWCASLIKDNYFSFMLISSFTIRLKIKGKIKYEC